MSAALPVAVAALAGVAAALATAPAPRLRAEPARSAASAREPAQAALRRFRPVLAMLVALCCWVLLGGSVGALAGVGAGVAAWRTLGRAESPAQRRRRERVSSDLPTAVALLSLCLSSGAATVSALDAVSDAIGGPAGAELRAVAAKLRLGADPAAVWRELDGPWAPLGRSLARSASSGAAVAAVIARLADDLRGQARDRAETRARTVEVRAAAPLGLCFLPAFVLMGVIPLTVGIFTAMPLLG